MTDLESARTGPPAAPPGERRSTLFASALVVLCAALAAVDAALVLRNRELSARVEELTGLVRAAGRSPVPPLEGRRFPADELLDADGRPVLLDGLPDDHATLLLVSSMACDYCELAAPTWERAARRAAGTRLRVLGLVLDATPATLDSDGAPYPLLAPADPTLPRHVPAVPAALLIDATGTVRWSIEGGDPQGLVDRVDAFLACDDANDA